MHIVNVVMLDILIANAALWKNLGALCWEIPTVVYDVMRI